MKLTFLSGIALLLSLAGATLAQENQELGRMWTFENPPLDYFETEYGFKPDQEWLDSLRLGSLRVGGEDAMTSLGSASFVSPNGLILTSTRCARDAVARTRPGDLDMINTGFVAATLEHEIRLRSSRTEWLTAAQLNKITNITDKVNKGVLPTDIETQVKAKREANKQTILDAARKANPELMPQIVSFYHGGIFQLYQHRVYNDLRLVCIPHLQTAHFGGDPDNFTYPRYCIDFAFLRAYEDGKPVDTTKLYFKWKSGGALRDELVFVSGNPGTTNRLFTRAQMEFERDMRIPIKIEQFTNALRIWEENPSSSYAWVRTRILELENGQKAARGNLHGLNDAKLMAPKTAAEKKFKGRVMADKNLAEKYGNIWDRIASVANERRPHEARERFYSTGGLALLDAAINTVQSCEPAETEEHRNKAQKTLNRWGDPLSDNVYGRVFFVDHVDRARGWLSKDDPFISKALGGKSGGEFLNAIYGDSRFISGSPESAMTDSGFRSLAAYAGKRDALVKSGWKAIQASEDPAIVFARELVILMRENKKVGDDLIATEEALGAEIGRALLDCYGTNVSPDATTTLRFTDGVVKGYPSNGTVAPHRTTFYGLYARNAEFDNEYPFNLPKIWRGRKNEIDMTKSVNFVSTNDITDGNAGSVVVNKALEVVGLIVDGNIESLHNDFVFKDDVPRAVSVHVDGIMEALVKIYDAHRVAKELTGK